MTKIGICFGGYCPMHQGHLDLIMQAKKENDVCLVVVCGYNGEKRAEDIGLPLRRRYTLVKKLFKNDEQIKVIQINDTEIGIDESMSNTNWRIWTDAIRKELETFNLYSNENQYTFYVAEWIYKQALLKNCIFSCDVIYNEKVNEVSGTLIRNNPLKYWNKIAKTYQPYFSTNILITGTASEGKTTLTKDIATYFGIPYSEEYGRTYMEENAKNDTDLTVNDFIEFLIEQRRDTKNKIESAANTGIVISDTDNLVTLMYAKAYTEDPAIDITEDDYNNILLPLAKTLQRGISWDKIFLLPPKNTFVDDGSRYMKQSTMEERTANFNKLVTLLKEFGWYDKVEILNGTYLENFNKVKNFITSK